VAGDDFDPGDGSTAARQQAAIAAVERARSTREAIGRLAGLLGSTQEYYRQAVAAGDTSSCRRVTNAALAAFDACPQVVAGSEASGLGIMRILAASSAHPDLQIAGLAVDAWPTLRNEVSVESRPPSMGAVLMRQVLESLLRGAVFPESFTSWEAHMPASDGGGPEDEDDFVRFREGGVARALEACVDDLGVGPFLDFLRGLLSHAADGSAGWQAVEVVLFAIAITHL